MPYRILTLDGGGIRGAFTAQLLTRLDAAVPGFLANVDLIAGTSTGGIIALGLAFGLTPPQLVGLYRDNGKKIFDDSWWDDLRDVGKIAGADYDNTKLRKILESIFGTRKLSALGKKVLIPSFDLDNEQEYGEPRSWKPKFFHNFSGEDSDGSELIVDVALSTSAAPTYFPSYRGYIDGGVVANNPSIAALAQALDSSTGGQQLTSVRLFSVGTGQIPGWISGREHDWGYGQWAAKLIPLMMEGTMGVADYQCRRLLKKNYHRLAPRLPKSIALDDAGKVTELIDYANDNQISPIQDTVRWLQANFL